MKFGGSRPDMESGFELNLASIVDCFTVLITYLLAAASFVSIGMVPAESFVSGQDVRGPQPSSIMPVEQAPQVIVEMMEGNHIRFSVWSGGSPQKNDFNFADLPQVDQYMSSLKTRFPTLDHVLVASDPNVTYDDFIRNSDYIHKQGLKIYLINGDSGT